MRQVIYSSRARGPDAAGDLADILALSKNNNPELGITGVLVVMGDVYLQFIEGPEENLEALLDFIRTDSRHTDMEILSERPAPHREFGDWAMGHHDVVPGSASDAKIQDALRAVRRGRTAAICTRLAEVVAETGRAARRRAPAPPPPGAVRPGAAGEAARSG